MAGKFHEVVHTSLPGDLGRFVGAAVIDDQVFQDIYAGDAARKRLHGMRQGSGFIVARDLNN